MTSDSQPCPSEMPRNGDFEIAADEKLVAEGWVRRFLADEPRAKEAIDLYTSLGYEVKEHNLVPDDFADKCGDCRSASCRAYVMIYTRKLNKSQRKDES